MHRNPYASLAPSEPRFQRPARASREDRTDSDSGFKRAEGSGSGFKRADGSGFKREEGGSGFKRADGSGFKPGSGFKREEFKRADGSGSGFKRADGGTGLKGEASPFNANSESAFPALGGQERTPRQAPVWVKGQDTAKVIERALQVKTPPPPPVARILEDFLPLEASYSSSDEDDYIPTFEGGGGWGESSWDD